MYKQLPDSVVSWIYRTLFISFFLPMKWQTIIIILFSIMVVVCSITFKIILKTKEVLVALLLGGGYLFYLVYIALTPIELRGEIYSLLERKISLFVLPFIFLAFSKMHTVSFRKHLIWFAGSTIVLSLIGNGILLYQAILEKQQLLLYHVEYRVAFENLTHIHPTYFGMYLCFAIGILMLYGNEFIQFKILNYIAILALFVSLLLLLPKSGLISILLLFFYFLFFVFQSSLSKKLIWSLIVIGAICLSYITLTFVHQRIDELIHSLSGTTSDLKNNSVEMRSLIFKQDIILLKKHWLWGLGPAVLQQQLNILMFISSIYAQQGLGNFNTHNEYLNQWLSFGVLGFAFFIFILSVHWRRAIINSNVLYIFLLIILCTSFFTENVLSRQHGILFYALFSSLFFFDKRNLLLDEKRNVYI